MNGTQDSSQNEDQTPPVGYRSLLSIAEMSIDELANKKLLVDVIGIVKDCQPPIMTRGSGILDSLPVLETFANAN